MHNFPPSRRPRLTGPIEMEQLTLAARSAAALELSAFADHYADDLFAHHKWGWVAVPMYEVRTLKQLVQDVVTSAATKVPLPINSLGSDDTIYGDVRSAMNMRYAAAINTMQQASRYAGPSYLAADLYMVDFAEAEYELSDTALRYLEADLTGHTKLSFILGQPLSSAEFTYDVVALGFDDAVILEGERREARVPQK